ncbi:MAG: phosphotyrosine protein phosphatase [Halomonas sp.]|nr:phosphotyrosine protein phosphatase [Halomonas sp.]TVP43493.1 MAG: phosphotyrosine protein phosphatase [Halomonas sp.]
MNLLFICSENRLRSPTAERVFSAYPGIQAIGAGTGANAKTPVSWALIKWADIVLVMEKSHRDEVAKTYGERLKGKRLVCLDIPDRYEFMQPELIKLLKERVPEYVRLSSGET